MRLPASTIASRVPAFVTTNEGMRIAGTPCLPATYTSLNSGVCAANALKVSTRSAMNFFMIRSTHKIRVLPVRREALRPAPASLLYSVTSPGRDPRRALSTLPGCSLAQNQLRLPVPLRSPGGGGSAVQAAGPPNAKRHGVGSRRGGNSHQVDQIVALEPADAA